MRVHHFVKSVWNTLWDCRELVLAFLSIAIGCVFLAVLVKLAASTLPMAVAVLIYVWGLAALGFGLWVLWQIVLLMFFISL